ncbi:hypothetical protein B296_00035880 [Ensete ventricosum]|uniref:Uncharacterized protein n=1 Tax=Ensete ventricosum TaxID=4639 RepID=A0A426XW71_ENSVE|nr:hypothetical protein B296_00035880 [Ensete ventricosum]
MSHPGVARHVQHYRGGCQGVRLCHHPAPQARCHHQLLLPHRCRRPATQG